MNKIAKTSMSAALLVLLAAPASADSQGDSGRVAGMVLNETGSDISTVARGKVVIDSAGVLQPYFWDGTVCAAHALTESEEALLAGLIGNKKVLITPYWKPGQGALRCLVSFVLGDKKSIPNIPQFP